MCAAESENPEHEHHLTCLLSAFIRNSIFYYLPNIVNYSFREVYLSTYNFSIRCHRIPVVKKFGGSCADKDWVPIRVDS
jgi:hypothetical protein